MPQVDPLIRPKLRLPFIRPGLVVRPRLQEQVEEGLRGPLTLVTAPAGFGKTTLVAGCIAGGRLRAAWYSLDKHDNQAGRFLRYLIAALQSVDDRVGIEAAQLMEGLQPAGQEGVLTSLVNDLDSTGTEMILVFDDYQLISSQAVHEAVKFLLDHQSRMLHLVITTRSDPPLPLSRLRARGQLVELRAADLRFTPSEAGQFLNDVMGLHLEAEAVAALEERTEGWIAGLQMAALSMRDRRDVRGFIEGFSGTNRYILDYLLEEVLALQPPETQRFLMCTSILERLTAPLCAVLLAGEGSTGLDGNHGASSTEFSNQQLEYLDRENLFLIALDDGWFRYHHLFADLLQARLQQTEPGLVPRLHLRASDWLEQNGYLPDAIQHLLATQEDARAADLIEHYGPVRWEESDLSVIQMADSLPRKILLERPKIGLYQAWLLINLGQIEKALPLLFDLVQHEPVSPPAPEQQWTLTVVQLALAFLTPTDLPGISPLPDPQVLDEVPASEVVLRDAAEVLYAMAMARRGNVDGAVAFALRCSQRERVSIKALPVPSVAPFLATMYWFQGRLHAAAALCREILIPLKEKGIRVSSAGNMDIVLGGVLYEWNCLEEAENDVRAGLKANEPWGNIMTDAFGLLALVHILTAKGDDAGALQTVDQFEARLQEPSRPVEFREDFHTLRARVHLACGDLQFASDWADRVRFSEDFHLHPNHYRVTLAMIRLAQGRYAEVEKLLAGIHNQELAGNRINRQIEVSLLLAGAAAGQQRLAEAFEKIEACLALAEPDGHIRVFLDVSGPVRDLLAAYLRTDAPGYRPFAQKILEAFSTPPNTDGPGLQPTGLVEALSGRELEILALMALGKTNQEIASQLIVAPGTIKAHAANIYRKLDAANRTEAVARARQLGILS